MAFLDLLVPRPMLNKLPFFFAWKQCGNIVSSVSVTRISSFNFCIDSASLKKTLI